HHPGAGARERRRRRGESCGAGADGGAPHLSARRSMVLRRAPAIGRRTGDARWQGPRSGTAARRGRRGTVSRQGTMNGLGWIIASALACPALVRADEPTLAPFSAHYDASWKSINVGTSDLELKPDSAPGRYVYTWTISARGVFRVVYHDDVVQTSWLGIDGG